MKTEPITNPGYISMRVSTPAGQGRWIPMSPTRPRNNPSTISAFLSLSCARSQSADDMFLHDPGRKQGGGGQQET